MTDIYSLQFDPHKLSHQQEQLHLLISILANERLQKTFQQILGYISR